MRRLQLLGLSDLFATIIGTALLLACGSAIADGGALRPGVFPEIIPAHEYSKDPSGTTETFNTAAPTDTRQNAFFQSIGTNGRACVSCHEPRSAWAVSAASIQDRFRQSNGLDPIFRPNDGATCDTADVSTLDARRTAYKLLLEQGLIRIGLTIPASQLGSNPPVPPDFQITSVTDPYGCTNLSVSPQAVSFYRRPLPSANLEFLLKCPSSNPGCAPLSIMWDGREPSLASQAIDATLGHAQAASPPTADQLDQIVGFETAIFDAQIFDEDAGRLDKHGATGGPENLSTQEFFIGINDVLSPGFSDLVFNLYDAWASSTGTDERAEARSSVARGQALFNARQFTIDKVNGLNLFPFDPLGAAPLTTGTCTTCHDSPNVGNHSKKLSINIGIPDAVTPVLNISALPVFTVACTETSGPLAGVVFKVTDLGRAAITGKCADVGKFKGPILHGLAARSPYFHNGSAATLDDVVNFYDQRFNIGFTNQEKADLKAFLQTL